MQQESKEATSTQITMLEPPGSRVDERTRALLQEQRRLLQANQLVIEDLRQTLCITYLLREKHRRLLGKWKSSIQNEVRSNPSYPNT